MVLAQKNRQIYTRNRTEILKMDLSIYNEMTTDKDAENTLFEIVFLICDDGKIEYPHTEN